MQSFDTTTWQRLRDPMFENKAKAIVKLLRWLLSHKFCQRDLTNFKHVSLSYITLGF